MVDLEVDGTRAMKTRKIGKRKRIGKRIGKRQFYHIFDSQTLHVGPIEFVDKSRLQDSIDMYFSIPGHSKEMYAVPHELVINNREISLDNPEVLKFTKGEREYEYGVGWKSK